MQMLEARELAAWLADKTREQPLLLDVREPDEFAYCAIAGSISMPMGMVPSRQQEIDPERDVVCICHHGVRSMQVAMFLERAGCEKVINLVGGVEAWARDVDPSMPVY